MQQMLVPGLLFYHVNSNRRSMLLLKLDGSNQTHLTVHRMLQTLTNESPNFICQLRLPINREWHRKRQEKDIISQLLPFETIANVHLIHWLKNPTNLDHRRNFFFFLFSFFSLRRKKSFFMPIHAKIVYKNWNSCSCLLARWPQHEESWEEAVYTQQMPSF